MHIRRFQAPTMLEAVQKVKAALGPDALVLSTRTLRQGQGVFGLLGRSMVEVTAAIDRDAAPKANPETKGGAAAATSTPPVASEPGGSHDPGLADELRALREQVGRLASGGPGRDALLRELAELRTVTAELSRGRVPEAPDGVEGRLAGRLLAGGLAARHALPLGRAAALRTEVTGTERAALREALRASFDRRMTPPRIDDAVEVEILVGPTGVGKTTTLAKLAAREEREAGGVALLTADTHRHGAIEQLKHYAQALGVPFGVAGDAAELRELIEARPARRVLVDTAGRGADAEAMRQLGELRQAAGDRARVSLVLSATADERQLRAEWARHAPLLPDALILTKFDECASWSAAANLVLDEDVPPLYWTAAGQRVPEDLDPAEPDRFSEALLRAGDLS